MPFLGVLEYIRAFTTVTDVGQRRQRFVVAVQQDNCAGKDAYITTDWTRIVSLRLCEK
ncbi:MAG: hypothetical protein KF784_04100 [Fimbriimonadaceae bacterium]|nr:hypothetical protein [Fimbriimonadaceae bacterium]